MAKREMLIQFNEEVNYTCLGTYNTVKLGTYVHSYRNHLLKMKLKAYSRMKFKESC